MTDKVRSMKEAIEAFVRPGDTLFLSGMQHGEPAAAIHEVIRQGIGHLTVVAALNQTVGLMVAEGLVDKLIMAYLRDLYDKRQGYTMQKAKKNSRYPKLEEYSHFGLALALLAGQMGIPFIPNRTHLGSDIEKYNDNIKRLECPFTGETLGAVGAVNPDIGILHVQIAECLLT